MGQNNEGELSIPMICTAYIFPSSPCNTTVMPNDNKQNSRGKKQGANGKHLQSSSRTVHWPASLKTHVPAALRLNLTFAGVGSITFKAVP